MSDVVYEGKVEKFSLGRSTGVGARNWKTRHMRLTQSVLSYGDGPSATPKLEIPISAVSLLFRNPTTAEHAEASGSGAGNMIMLRLFANGVFNLLIKAPNDVEKSKWVTALSDVLGKVKGAQVV